MSLRFLANTPEDQCAVFVDATFDSRNGSFDVRSTYSSYSALLARSDSKDSGSSLLVVHFLTGKWTINAAYESRFADSGRVALLGKEDFRIESAGTGAGCLIARVSVIDGCLPQELSRRLFNKGEVIWVRAEKELKAVGLGLLDSFARDSVNIGVDQLVSRSERWLSRLFEELPVGNLTETVSGEVDDMNAGRRRVCRKALDYMSSHFSRPISIEDVASHVGLSTRHLHRVFKTELGKTPSGVLNETRLEMAKEKLENGGWPCVKTIAYECGFSSHSYFTLKYRKYYSARPSEHHRYVHDASAISYATPKRKESEL